MFSAIFFASTLIPIIIVNSFQLSRSFHQVSLLSPKLNRSFNSYHNNQLSKVSKEDTPEYSVENRAIIKELNILYKR
jgi:predicted amidophosphoribosyltransferase